MFRCMKMLLAGRLDTRGFLECLREDRKASQGMVVEQPALDTFLGTLPETKDYKSPVRIQCLPGYFTSDKYIRYQERADWRGTDRRIQEFAARLVLELRKRNVPFYVNCAYRTPGQQAKLYKQGRSKVLHPNAAHPRGAAVDVVHTEYHWDLTRGEWSYIGTIGKRIAHDMGIDIQWGGDWSFWDPAHWEIKNYRTECPVPEIDTFDPLRKTPSKIRREGWAYIKGSRPNK